MNDAVKSDLRILGIAGLVATAIVLGFIAITPHAWHDTDWVRVALFILAIVGWSGTAAYLHVRANPERIKNT